MTPSEVVDPGLYRWTWAAPGREPRTGTIRVERKPFQKRLSTEHGIYLDEVAKRWPEAVVTMEKVGE